jgi:hypothetical protein
MMTFYTLDDLNAATTALDAILSKWDRYSGNNPDKFSAKIADVKVRVHEITVALKASGVVARTEDEERDHQLDLAFPSARSKQIVLWNGNRYERVFTPVATSLSGTSVKAWAKTWRQAGDRNDS